MYVCIYYCMYVLLYVCMYVLYMYVCMYVLLYVWMYVFIYYCIVCIIVLCMYVLLYVWMCVCTYVCIHVKCLQSEEHIRLLMYKNIRNVCTITYWRVMWKYSYICVGEKRNAHRFFVRKYEGTGPLGRPRYRWDDNIKMCLKETWWVIMDCIDFAQHMVEWRTVVNTVMNICFP
jgi:hypothetical protein